MKTQDAIKKAKDVRALAALLKISTSAVYAWGEDVPELRALQLEKHYAKLAKKGKK